MLTLLSPAKSLNFEDKAPIDQHSSVIFHQEVKSLILELKQLSAKEIEKLMSISPKLAELNQQRFAEFGSKTSQQKQALFAYDGDVYQGLEARSLLKADIEFAQAHLLILSGLYGLLRPLDLIEAYRLEMSIKLKTKSFKDLYAFWGDKLTEALNKIISEHKHKVIVNCASNEYSEAIDPKKLDAKWLKVDFKEQKGSEFKVVAIHAKKARGLMARFIIQNKIDSEDKLKQFNLEGYRYNAKLSDQNCLVFSRQDK
ncbi:MAG: hypothetical protein K0R66_679 [Gammaproteobacteria bacterium]|jgi:cytoplasmic iron level regulating protein YaaA (DUF328/UPF0246 family)|nr:hypothetical protein [Gammaproteobacteria bacterium]